MYLNNNLLYDLSRQDVESILITQTQRRFHEFRIRHFSRQFQLSLNRLREF